jgi:hypothetical protein
MENTMFEDSKKVTAAMKSLLADCASPDPMKSFAASRQLAIALELPLRKGMLRGNIIKDIFDFVKVMPGEAPEYPYDLLTPGTEKDFAAYVMPNHGYIPQRTLETDFIQVPTYMVTNAIDLNWKIIRDSNWRLVDRAIEICAAGFVRKMNQDGWRTILAAAAARGLVVYDDAATAGLFTKRLVELASQVMRRNSGGNSTSLNRGRLTHLFVSPESVGDMRSWDITQVDDFTRREIFLAGDGAEEGTKIFGKFIVALDEFGVGQEFQQYYEGPLAQTMPTDKVEIGIGLDLQTKDSFYCPIRQEPTIYEDPALHRQLKWGCYGIAEWGFACFDNRRVLACAI